MNNLFMKKVLSSPFAPSGERGGIFMKGILMKRILFLSLLILCIAFITFAQTPSNVIKPASDTLKSKAKQISKQDAANQKTAKKAIADSTAKKAANAKNPKDSLANVNAKTDSVTSLKAIKIIDTISPQLTINKPEFIPVADSIKIPVLDFKNTDVRDILRAIGMQYNVNIFLETDVVGTLSLYLTNISVKNAIDFVVKRGNFSYMYEKGIVKVFKPTALPPPAAPKPSVVFHLHDGLLDIDAKGANAKDLAQMFVDSANINVVPDAKVDKQINVHVKGLKPDKALKVVFETNGFDVTVSDGLYYVSPQNWGATGADGKPTGTQDQRRLSVTISKTGRVSLEVNNAALDQLVRSIAMQSGINIIIYESISGTVTAKFDSVELDDVLRFLLQNTKYTFWKDKSIYFLGSREMSQQKTTVIITLKNIMADDDLANKLLPPNITKDAVVRIDKEHNSVIVIGSFDIVAQAQEFLAKVDQPVPQVLIEALVVDFNLSKTRQYGLQLFVADTVPKMQDNYFPAVSTRVGQPTLQHALNEVLRYTHINDVVSLPANFMGMINALEQADIAKVHSTPQIATLNGNTASITIGETQYFKLTSDVVNPSSGASGTVISTSEHFEKYQFDNKLEVTPWVMADRYVTVKIKPEFNIPRTKDNSGIPPTADKRDLESIVRLRDGQTIVLGGQRNTSETESKSGVPFLSSIPVLGWFFSNTTKVKNETQMMIFVTPHVYYKDEGTVNPQDFFKSKLEDFNIDKDKTKKK